MFAITMIIITCNHVLTASLASLVISRVLCGPFDHELFPSFFSLARGEPTPTTSLEWVLVRVGSFLSSLPSVDLYAN